MSNFNLFLTLDKNEPLGIYIGSTYEVVDFDVFVQDSLIDMSEEQAKRWAVALRDFADRLDRYDD